MKLLPAVAAIALTASVLALASSCTMMDKEETASAGETFRFDCPGGISFSVRYADENTENATLELEGKSYPLSRAKSASGAKYDQSDGPVVFWEHGGTAFVETGEGSSIGDCILAR